MEEDENDVDRTQWFAGIYACIFSFSLIGRWFTTVDISYMM